MKAYHSGFSHGFNVGEAVNFATPLSISYIKQAMEFYLKKKATRVMERARVDSSARVQNQNGATRK